MHRGKIADFEHRLESEAQKITWSSLKDQVDFIYIATHGRYAEDGTLQGFLEILGIPYLGSKVFASALRMDKIIQKSILRSYGIDVPRSIALCPEQISDYQHKKTALLAHMQQENISFPCVVKPHKEGSSIGVSFVQHEEKLYDALWTACIAYPEKQQAVLIEEALSGMEFSCVTLVDYKTNAFKPLPPTEIIPEGHVYDYEQKYMPGRAIKFTPARCSPDQIRLIQDTCIRVMKALDFTTMSRIDGFLTADNRVVIIDPNTLSGMGPASFIFLQAAECNMSHTNLINHLIETELHQHGMLASLDNESSTVRTINKITQKIRVAVLMGGDSNEREISLESGRNVVYKLSPAKYEAIPIFVDREMRLYVIDQRLLVRNSTHEISLHLKPGMQIDWDDLKKIADFVFIALHGGKGENGCVQGALEMLHIPYNGSSVLTSALCMNKYKTTEFLREQGFDVPSSYLLEKTEWATAQEIVMATIEQNLSFPVIVKPHDDGCSAMVSKVTNQTELIQAVNSIFDNHKMHVMVEEYITGMELTVGVIGNQNPKALPPSQAVATAGILSIEEKFLPGAGENQTPAPLPQSALMLVQEKIAQAFKSLDGKGYARIDCFYQAAEQSKTGKERIIILEVNSLPGLTPATCIFHQAAEIGIKPMDFIDLIVQLGFNEHQKNSEQRQTTYDVQHTQKNIFLNRAAR